MAMISAWAVGSVCLNTQLPELTTIRVTRTTIAPNGPPLPASSVCSARSTAICINRLRSARAALRLRCGEALGGLLIIFQDIISNRADQSLRSTRTIFFLPAIVAAAQIGEQFITDRNSKKTRRACRPFLNRGGDGSRVMFTLEIEREWKTVVLFTGITGKKSSRLLQASSDSNSFVGAVKQEFIGYFYRLVSQTHRLILVRRREISIIPGHDYLFRLNPLNPMPNRA